ncbi:hypothetical protein HNR42_001325 [Deinobacterium chartae]|uniref:Uncharacterized protein n=1 Tax=Deinobacterium chartae TaxID=521158 RepID=A0A841I1F4_9DEIO|nr:Ig-like domain-containing protein [Deinobacterium chartae]MBB6097902.1 hypothetical protein [Deinobacterium chartae]
MKRVTLLLTGVLLLGACSQTHTPQIPPKVQTGIKINTPGSAPVEVTLRATDGTVYTVNANGTLDLPPGTYVLSAGSYKYDGYTYATPEQTVVIEPGKSPEVTVTYVAITGAMVVVVDAIGDVEPLGRNSPNSASAQVEQTEQPVVNVTVTGPGNYSKTFTEAGSYRLEDLAPGSYVITGPSGQSSAAQVMAGQTQQAGSVSLTGMAQLAFTGLPQGIKPILRLQNANGAIYRIPPDYLASGLAAGSYTFRAVVDPKSAGRTYRAEPVTFEVRVGETSSSTLNFAPIDARLTVNVQSVEGVTPQVTLAGPDGYQQQLTAAGEVSFDYLKPGDYVLSAEQVNDGSYEYTPVLSASTFTLTAGQDFGANVTYGVSTGNLNVKATGLPSGTQAALTLKNASGTVFPLPADGRVRGLVAGTYILSAADVTAGGFTYRAPQSQVELTAGSTADLTADYAPTDGRIELTVNVPQGTTPNVLISGPEGFSRSVTQAAPPALEHLKPGDYQVAAQRITDGTYSYTAQTVPPTLTVSAGQTARATTQYQAVTGALKVNLEGLPSAKTLPLTGPNGAAHTVQDDSVLNDLEPGTYTLSDTAFTQDGWRYQPSGAVAQTVTAGQRADLGVSFERQDVAAPASVTLTSTAASYPVGTAFPLNASAQDNDRVVKFELYQGSQKLTETNAAQQGSGYQARFDVTSLPVGSYSYSVVAVDAAGLRSESTPVTITVFNPNRNPVIAPISQQTLTLGADGVRLNHADFFTDPDGDAVTVRATARTTGIVQTSTDGTALVLTPVAAGSTQVDVTVTDGRGGSATSSFTVVVNNLNRNPVIAPIPPQVLARNNPGARLYFSAFFSDPDGDRVEIESLTVQNTAIAQVSSVSVSNSARVFGIDPVSLGTTAVTVRVRDGKGGFAEQTFPVTVRIPTPFFSEYLDAGDGRIAIEVLFTGDGSPDQVSGYQLEVHQWMKRSSQKSVSTLNLHPIQPNLTYHIINNIFYDFFDLVNVLYYNNDEVNLYNPTEFVTTALVLKRNGQVIDVLGDPGANARNGILPQPATLIRKPATAFGSSSFDLQQWNSLPAGTFSDFGRYTR